MNNPERGYPSQSKGETGHLQSGGNNEEIRYGCCSRNDCNHVFFGNGRENWRLNGEV
jgi:hypothetical protein